VLTAAGITALRRRGAALLCAGIVVFCGLSLMNYHLLPRYGREDVRAAAAAVSAHEEPGDVVVVPVVRDVFRHYYEGDAPTVALHPGETTTDERVEERLREIVGGAERVWFVDSRLWKVDRERRTPRVLSEIYEETRSTVFPGARVTLYRTPGGERHDGTPGAAGRAESGATGTPGS
jgi:hypothetical protein